MNYTGVILAVIVSFAILGNVSSGRKKNKSKAKAKVKDSAPKWKTSSMPFQKDRFPSSAAGEKVKLDCRAVGSPKPTIEWIKDGVKIPADETVPKITIKRFYLLLDDVTTHMSGNYTCVVNNKLGSIEWTFMLDVTDIIWPLVVEGPQNVTQMVGGHVAFQCRVLNDPVATIRWQRIHKDQDARTPNTEYLPDGDDPEVLMIENVKKEHEGEYRCLAGNFKGLKYSSVWLNVIEPVTTPAPPRHFGSDNDDRNIFNVNGVDDFGQPYDPHNPNIFDIQNTFYTTTRRPRNKNKGRGKNGRKKNKKNKNKVPKTRPPPPPTTTPLSFESSSDWMWTEDTTPSTPSTFDFYDWQRSTFPTDNEWTIAEEDNGNVGGAPDVRSYNPDPNNVDAGTASNSKDDKKRGDDISEWKIYTIVGAVGGVVLLIGLVAITIAVCCPKQEGAVYKATPV